MSAPMQLRPHQVKALELIRERMKMRERRIVLELVTAGGKTACAVAMIQAAVAKGGRCLFVVNRTQLLNQTVERFASQGIDAGIIQGKNTTGTHKRVLVASIATLHLRPKEMPDDLALLVIDEAHAAGGDSRLHKLIHHVHGKAPKAAIIGLTATPWASGMGKHYEALEGPLFQSKVCPVTAAELIDQGYLCDCEIYAPPGPDMTGVKVVAGEYDEDQSAERMEKLNIIGDIVTTYLKHGSGKKAVLFAPNIAFSQKMAEEFTRVGIDARHIDYRKPEAEKNELLKAFDNDEFRILCNPLLLREGWDCPSVEVLIMARPTRSLISWAQIAGRVLRTFPGKKIGLILDHSGTSNRLGFPTDDRSDEPLDDGKPKSASEKKEKEKKEAEKLPKACTECHFLKPAGVHECPACGHIPRRPSDIEVLPGELVLVKRSAKHKAEDPALRFGPKQHLWSMLLGFAEERNYSRHWASHNYKSITSAWPRSVADIACAPSPELRSWIKANTIRWANAKKAAELRA